MAKVRKSNRESKKEPAMTLKEKRAAKKSKDEDKAFLGSEGALRKPNNAPALRRS